jgi:hypothetical protein
MTQKENESEKERHRNLFGGKQRLVLGMAGVVEVAADRRSAVRGMSG